MTHSREIQMALDYIEVHLGDQLTVDDISKAVGFSKFYFHRTFQDEVGIPIYDYIKKRRLANADFQEVDRNTPTTEFVPDEVFPDHLVNPSFEEA